MTKKDYILIANTFKNYKAPEQPMSREAELRFLIDNFCEMLKQDNPNFDKDKFLKACGL